MKKILLGLLALGATACSTGQPAGSLAEPLSVQKIWNQAPHSAFTDLIDYEGNLYCCFREANSHVPKKTGVAGDNGVIRILRSADGTTWESAAVLTLEGVDLRDPGISQTADGRLMVVMGGSVYLDGVFQSGATQVSFMEPGGTTFSDPVPVQVDREDFPGRFWLWRVRWNGEAGYGVVYEADIENWRISLVSTTDGVSYDLVTRLEVDSMPNETDLLFGEDGELTLIVRREEKKAHGKIGYSRYPYDTWTWRDCGYQLGGPAIYRLPDGEVIVGSREYIPGDAYTTLFSLGDDGRLSPLCRLPSGGDCSYPGFAVRGDKLYMSYYSKHEEEKDCIYLATFRLP